MYILAIDPGIERTGYAVFNIENKTCKLINADCIVTSKKLNHEKRLYLIQEKVENIIKNNEIELIVMEDLFMFKNQKTIISVARAQGVTLSLAGKYNINNFFLTPLQIKSIITGYGRADKKSIAKMISYSFPDMKKALYDDTIDAVACGYAYYLFTHKTMEYNTI